jgi:protein-histidine pros-kinase
VSHRLLFENAREEILGSARMIMASAIGARTYTSKQVAPLLRQLPGDEFLPQTVPAYAATEQFATLRAQFPDFAYKEAVLNPTNLRNKATDWEVDVVNRFRQYPDQKEMVVRARHPRRQVARPGQADPHRGRGLPPVPQHRRRGASGLLRRYGPANGFGWQLHEVIGAQLVSVPMSLRSSAPTRRSSPSWARSAASSW